MRSEKVRKSREIKSFLRPFKFICCWLQAVRSSGLEGGQEAFIADKDQGVFCMEVTAGNSGAYCSVFLGKRKTRGEPRWRTELWAGAAGGRREESWVKEKEAAGEGEAEVQVESYRSAEAFQGRDGKWCQGEQRQKKWNLVTKAQD